MWIGPWALWWNLATTLKNKKLILSADYILEKSYTCEEGGAHLRISFWHLGIDELEKQIIIKKTVEVGQLKQNSFNIYNITFFKKKI